jgi:hypothetical protein
LPPPQPSTASKPFDLLRPIDLPQTLRLPPDLHTSRPARLPDL